MFVFNRKDIYCKSLPCQKKKNGDLCLCKKQITYTRKDSDHNKAKTIWSGNPGGEDGGIWFSLEYPLLLGIATFDNAEARSLLLKFSFQNYAVNYPAYRIGQ